MYYTCVDCIFLNSMKNQLLKDSVPVRLPYITEIGNLPFFLVFIGYVWKARRLAWRNVHMDVHFRC